MYRFSFKIRHKNCFETGLSIKFPKHHITVIDIQSTHPKEKQYFYYITGKAEEFDRIISHLKRSKGYKKIKEIERSKDTLLLLVVLYQKLYIQNVIQKYNGFFIDLHTVSEGYEYWHVGVVEKDSIDKMLKMFKKIIWHFYVHINKPSSRNQCSIGISNNFIIIRNKRKSISG